ncbi:MAG: HNH endonuclease [Acidimicrobiales bacterium]
MAAPTDSKPPRPLVTVHVGAGTIERMCELASGTVIAPGLLVPHLGHADVERIIYGPGKRVIELSKRARFFSGGLRRAIELRDRWCFHPTCDVPAERCQIDHGKPVSRGGETTQANGRSACDIHNWWTYNFEHATVTYPPTQPRPTPAKGGASDASCLDVGSNRGLTRGATLSGLRGTTEGEHQRRPGDGQEAQRALGDHPPVLGIVGPAVAGAGGARPHGGSAGLTCERLP